MKTYPACARFAALPLALAAAFPSWAQTQLKEVVVTATRTETRADALTSDVVVIDAATIERSAGRTLSELLAREAGLQMAANGGLGKQSSVFVRGTESRHVLLLVDGVRLGSATSGAASFDNLPLEMIERIEVLKGPASALYGSDAVGGVVQVFTKKGFKGFAPHASLTLGSEGHSRVAAGVRGGVDTVSYAVSVSRLREDGFSATNPGVAFGGHNADRDGFDQDSLNASLRWKFAPDWQTDVHLTHADGTNQYDNGPAPFNVRSDVTSRVLGWGLQRQWAPGVVTRIKLSRSDDQSTNFGSATSVTRFNTALAQQSLQHEWGTPVGTLLLGLERLKESVDSTQAYALTGRSTTAAFVGLQGKAQGHLWQANVRRDDNSQFGVANTGFASYGYEFTPQWRAHGAYGTSFKVPSFNTLYYVSPSFKGNPTTQPERGKNRELGLAYSRGAHEVKLARFDNRVRGFITTAPVVANIPQARMEGWSLGYEGAHAGWNWRANMEWLDARNVISGKKLARRADQQFTAGLDHTAGAWTWGASVLGASSRFDNATNTVRLSGFGTMDLHARYALATDWALKLRLNNVGDKTYETARGFNQPGRAAYLTLDWQPRR